MTEELEKFKEQIEKFKEEILLNRECSGESNYIFVDDEEILQLINLIEKQQKEIEEYKNKLNEVYTGWKNNIERNMRITDGAFNLERK